MVVDALRRLEDELDEDRRSEGTGGEGRGKPVEPQHAADRAGVRAQQQHHADVYEGVEGDEAEVGG